MANVCRIVCLANSTKNNGSCIAGRQVLEGGSFGPWIRPISARPSAELYFSECQLQNNAMPRLMDIIDVPLLNAAPHNHQIENHLIDPSGIWTKVGELPRHQLQRVREQPRSLWINSDSTTTGALNCISIGEAAALKGSLLRSSPRYFGFGLTVRSGMGKRAEPTVGISSTEENSTA